MAIESPKYETTYKDKEFEIREYADYILAEIEIEGDYDSALQKGFRILADYIFGNNLSKTHINMTAPVTEQAARGEKIDMTTPVTSTTVEENKRYTVAFTMPSKYTLENLPEPVNKEISFHVIARHKVAVLRFSGNFNDDLAVRKSKELEKWLSDNKYNKKSNFIFAQYNPPWIPGFVRRNEIMAEI
jgi:DNA gyrase inhibitor GyrI